MLCCDPRGHGGWWKVKKIASRRGLGVDVGVLPRAAYFGIQRLWCPFHVVGLRTKRALIYRYFYGNVKS
jgi:hypothetical protein